LTIKLNSTPSFKAEMPLLLIFPRNFESKFEDFPCVLGMCIYGIMELATNDVSIQGCCILIKPQLYSLLSSVPRSRGFFCAYPEMELALG
jgi:hypothetical protein